MSRSKLVEMLTRHEGRRAFVYQCPAGHWTVGVGRNVDPDGGGYGLSSDEIDFMLENDIIRHHKELAATYRWYNDLDEIRQEALIDMHFNLGHSRFDGFTKMIAAFENGNMVKARDEMLDSKWARQVGSRATELAMMIWRGEYMPDAS
jgi:lysozyme